MKKVGFPTEPLRPTSRLQSPWFILIIVLLTSIAASLNQFKVPPIMPLLMEAFSQSGSRAGLLMSVFALTGLFLAIPAGFILQKLGYRAVGLMALFCLIVGAGIGALSRGMGIMLASRFIEGAGMSFMSVVAPAIIALMVYLEKKGKGHGGLVHLGSPRVDDHVYPRSLPGRLLGMAGRVVVWILLYHRDWTLVLSFHQIESSNVF